MKLTHRTVSLSSHLRYYHNQEDTIPVTTVNLAIETVSVKEQNDTLNEPPPPPLLLLEEELPELRHQPNLYQHRSRGRTRRLVDRHQREQFRDLTLAQ